MESKPGDRSVTNLTVMSEQVSLLSQSVFLSFVGVVVLPGFLWFSLSLLGRSNRPERPIFRIAMLS